MLPPSIDMASGRGPAPAGSSTAALGEIADQLADAVRVQLLREERSGVVAGPAPIPVHWIPTGHTTTPPALAGRFHQIGEVYQRIPSRRLAILGKEGSGKTTLAARLAVDLLAARGPGGRVPVVGTIESWNPSTSLGQWLATQLVHDYPGLAAPGPDGSTCASGLLATQRILPILDGFDELDPELRQAALRQLNMAPGLPLVLTSRPGEYAAAARSEGALVSAAEITLDDLIPDDLTGYLVHATRHATRHGTADSRADRWRSVLDVLRTYPDDPVATVLRQALSTPLMVSLARTVYSGTDGRDPAELLDRRRFPTRWAVEEHLLSAYVPACYQRPAPAGRRWNPDRGQRWLSHLANDLDRRGTRD
ncbi:MAG: NACHT domain-containing protein, partial [Dactylosporangium sp.]|nr:NACHT domain-containing protein [Dactylosporangium sp.]NNJ63510.1 NACHT domain-containing protein [Dactylosporangium sp.]